MKLNKEEIIFKADGKKTCDYCGISSFSHKHPVNTLPKDFERIKEEEEEDDMQLIAIETVKRIIEDLTQRRGLKQEWYNIDDDVKEEIIKSWELIVNNTTLEIFKKLSE